MAITHKAPQAQPRALTPAGTWGRNTKVYAKFEPSADKALVQNEKVAMCLIPAHSRVDDLRYVMDDIGESTAIQIGYESVDGSPVDADYFATEADTASPTSGRTSASPITFTKDTWITATQTADATADEGSIEIVVDYEFLGNP